MARFVEVARVEEVPPGTAAVVQVGGTELALVNVDGTFFAVDNECTHMGGFLGEGRSTTTGASGQSSARCTAAFSTSELGRCSIRPRRPLCERTRWKSKER